MSWSTPHMLTGFLLMGVGALYSQTQATPDHWADRPTVSMRFVTLPSLRPEVRISLAKLPAVSAGLDDGLDLAAGNRLVFHRSLKRTNAVKPGPRSGGLALRLALGAPAGDAGPAYDAVRDGFASFLIAPADAMALPLQYRTGAWAFRADPSAVDLGRLPHGGSLAGDYVPGHVSRGALQIALVF